MLGACDAKYQKPLIAQQDKIPDIVDYNLHIKPILSDRCFSCHGPDKNSRKAGLILYTSEGAYAELEENPGHYAIVPGNIDKSEVYFRIMNKDTEVMMPPPESNLELNDDERTLISKWIRQGAVYKPHWSFIPVEKPIPPTVQNSKWISNPIDNFILAKMESLGLEPEARASREKLIRRVTFDLTGLPPSLAEIDSFLNDNESDAYEKVVDRLLNSVSYSEQMTSRWLDISRYADSHGYQVDFYRSMWPWRDWVLESYHNNRPFDEFLTWQLAGDLLPEATYEQKLATGFNRNHSINLEGGIIKEEFRVEYVADRTNTLGTAVLGLTLECARCHDHKYDPISQNEYYQLYSFFNSVPQAGGTRHAPGPSVTYPEKKLNELRNYLANVKSIQRLKLEDRKKVLHADPFKDKHFVSWVDRHKKGQKSKKIPNPTSHFSFDNFDSTSTLSTSNNKNVFKSTKNIEPKPGKYAAGLFIENGHFRLGQHQFINTKQPFSISFWFFNNYYLSRNVILSKVDPVTGKGFKIEIDFEYINIYFQNSKNQISKKLVSKEIIPDLEWTHLVITYDGSGSTGGLSLFVNGTAMELVGEKTSPSPIPKYAPLIIAPNGLSGSGIDELSLYNQKLNAHDIKIAFQHNPIDVLLNLSFDNLEEVEQRRIVDHYLFHEDRVFRTALRNLEAVKYKHLDIPSKGDLRIMTMAEMAEPRKTYVLNRGAYDAPGEEVTHGTPKSILEFNDSLPTNRLGLAKWLFDPKNPLTSRVTINRYWQYIFGRGIVKTMEDFGNQGALPSHPELLDWLAATFMDTGWDTRGMIKLMVMSSTYQQSSTADNTKRNIDPENIYLARGTRYRMSGEMIRDQALAASGLLNRKIGGPGVRPYQPEKLWSSVTAVGGGPLAKYILDISEDLYRRSLYTFWKRTVPSPSMITFDAATRDNCSISRQNTNTPLQALVLLNGPQYMEAARVMAQNIMLKNQSIKGNITESFRRLTSRKPDKNEVEILEQVYMDNLNNFIQYPDLIPKLLTIGDHFYDESLAQNELAALTMTISTILNLDETISKE